MPATRALAFIHGPERVVALGHAFAAGCKAHGVECEVKRVEDLGSPKGVGVVWLYGLGPARPVFDAYAGRALRIVGDACYFQDFRVSPRPPIPKRYARISVDGAQLGELMNRRPHSPARFEALNLPVTPVTTRGDSILVTGRSARDARACGMQYGEWERATVARLQAVTSRPIVMREKPKNPPILIRGVVRCKGDLATAIRKSWAVVCRSGNVAIDALLHGVPVFAEFGPGALYQRGRLEDIDRAEAPSPELRMSALADAAWWQWTAEEMARGELWAHLKAEGVV